MQKIITKIDPSWAEKYPAIVERWTKIGLCTDPADRPRAEAGIRACYAAAKLPPPKVITWVSSPLVLALAGPISLKILNDASVDNNVDANVSDNVYANVSANVDANVSDNVAANVRDNVAANVRDNVRTNVSDNVAANVSANVSANVNANVRTNVSANVRTNVSANVDANVRANMYDNVAANVRANVDANVRANVRDNVYDTVRANMYDNVAANVRDNVNANVSANVRDNVRDNVYVNVYNNVYANVSANVDANVDANVSDNVSANVYVNVDDNVAANWYKYRGGAWWAGWHSYIDAMRSIVGVDPELLVPELAEAEVVQSAAWWYPCSTFCIVCDRPSFIGINADNQLHCDNGPAILFRDGWGIWAINGVRFDVDGEKIVMRPHEQTIAEIDAETNEEVRRIRIERFGWPRYLKETGAAVLDSRRNDIDNTMEVLCRDKHGAVKLLCSCRSTGRVYAIGVSRDVATCHAAQTWMRGGSRFASRGQVIGAS